MESMGGILSMTTIWVSDACLLQHFDELHFVEDLALEEVLADVLELVGVGEVLVDVGVDGDGEVVAFVADGDFDDVDDAVDDDLLLEVYLLRRDLLLEVFEHAAEVQLVVFQEVGAG